MEGSNDKSKWETIDEQKDRSYLNGRILVQHFLLKKSKKKKKKKKKNIQIFKIISISCNFFLSARQFFIISGAR